MLSFSLALETKKPRSSSNKLKQKAQILRQSIFRKYYPPKKLKNFIASDARATQSSHYNAATQTSTHLNDEDLSNWTRTSKKETDAILECCQLSVEQ